MKAEKWLKKSKTESNRIWKLVDLIKDETRVDSTFEREQHEDNEDTRIYYESPPIT